MNSNDSHDAYNTEYIKYSVSMDADRKKLAALQQENVTLATFGIIAISYIKELQAQIQQLEEENAKKEQSTQKDMQGAQNVVNVAITKKVRLYSQIQSKIDTGLKRSRSALSVERPKSSLTLHPYLKRGSSSQLNHRSITLAYDTQSSNSSLNTAKTRSDEGKKGWVSNVRRTSTFDVKKNVASDGHYEWGSR